MQGFPKMGINGLEHIQSILHGELAINVGGPVNFLQERFSDSTLAASSILSACRGCAQHAQCSSPHGRRGHASKSAGPRHKGREAAEAKPQDHAATARAALAMTS